MPRSKPLVCRVRGGQVTSWEAPRAPADSRSKGPPGGLRPRRGVGFRCDCGQVPPPPVPSCLAHCECPPWLVSSAQNRPHPRPLPGPAALALTPPHLTRVSSQHGSPDVGLAGVKWERQASQPVTMHKALLLGPQGLCLCVVVQVSVRGLGELSGPRPHPSTPSLGHLGSHVRFIQENGESGPRPWVMGPRNEQLSQGARDR